MLIEAADMQYRHRTRQAVDSRILETYARMYVGDLHQMISALKQCWHLKSQGWTDHCLMQPRSCSLTEAAIVGKIHPLPECMFTIFTSNPHFKLGIKTTFYSDNETHA